LEDVEAELSAEHVMKQAYMVFYQAVDADVDALADPAFGASDSDHSEAESEEEDVGDLDADELQELLREAAQPLADPS
jgi:hypothetical protein